MRLGVFGAGYVGLVAATGFADFGHTVCCGDIDAGVIDRLTSGDIPFSEPSLVGLLSNQVAAGRLEFSSNLAHVVNFADVLIIAVGTPALVVGSVDLSAVYAVALQISNAMKNDKTIVIKSTVPVGTCSELEKFILTRLHERDTDIRISVISNPEFLREGSAVADFAAPDRIIIGVNRESDELVARALYAPLIRR